MRYIEYIDKYICRVHTYIQICLIPSPLVFQLFIISASRPLPTLARSRLVGGLCRVRKFTRETFSVQTIEELNHPEIEIQIYGFSCWVPYDSTSWEAPLVQPFVSDTSRSISRIPRKKSHGNNSWAFLRRRCRWGKGSWFKGARIISQGIVT